MDCCCIRPLSCATITICAWFTLLSFAHLLRAVCRASSSSLFRPWSLLCSSLFATANTLTPKVASRSLKTLAFLSPSGFRSRPACTCPPVLLFRPTVLTAECSFIFPSLFLGFSALNSISSLSAPLSVGTLETRKCASFMNWPYRLQILSPATSSLALNSGSTTIAHSDTLCRLIRPDCHRWFFSMLHNCHGWDGANWVQFHTWFGVR